MKEYNKPRQLNTLRPLYGGDPLATVGLPQRSLSIANPLASNDDLTETTKNKNKTRTNEN